MKEFVLKITEDDEGKLTMLSTNDGFDGFELLGFLHFKTDDIMSQIKGTIKPDIIKRAFIDNEEEKNE